MSFGDEFGDLFGGDAPAPTPPIGGQLLVRRMQVQLETGSSDVDTGLVQANLGVGDDPPLGGSPLWASRVMVELLPPIDNWAGITIAEPYFDTTTGTVHVVFTNPGAATVVNVLFWDPHTMVGPVSAELYAVF